MSYNDWEPRMFTEAELEAGVMGLLNDTGSELSNNRGSKSAKLPDEKLLYEDLKLLLSGKDVRDQSKYRKYALEELRRISQIFSDINCKETVHKAYLRFLYTLQIRRAVTRYCDYERVPSAFGIHSLDPNYLFKLTYSFLKKYGGNQFQLLLQIEDRVLRFCDGLLQDAGNEVVYQRVGKLRRYVYEILSSTLNVNPAEIDSENFRVLLSLSRLTLYCNDYKKKDINNLLQQEYSTSNLHDFEKSNPHFTINKNGKTYVSRYKVRHLLNLSHFFKYEQHLKEVINLNLDTFDVDSLKKLLLKLHANRPISA